MIGFARFSYFVPVLKQMKKWKKSRKKVFLTVYPGFKSEFLRQKTFLKNFIYAFKTPVKYFRKIFASMIYPGSQIRGLPVVKFWLFLYF
jgi:hypothetical protein